MRPAAFVGAIAAAIVVGASSPPADAGVIAIPDVPMSSGYLGFCKNHSSQKEWSCYLHHLLRTVLKSRDPARELPQLDVLARQSGGFLEANCHMMMHVVGRAYALKHHVTLETLQRYLPRSNDPGCSAGFGMGLVMGLGPRLIAGGARVANAICAASPTRFRRYTCYHALGHAYMRLYHGYLSSSLMACHALGRQAPDCAQGAFHDYWLGLSGQDGARYTHGEPRTARALCARQRGVYAIACWYRYYLSLPPKRAPASASGIETLCHGLAGAQRAGCVASASLVSDSDPVVQFRICSQLPTLDVDSCLRGVGTQNLPDALSSGSRLISGCARLARPARTGCYTWLGTALTVLTDGRFARSGCPRISSPLGRSECVAGAGRASAPLVTFA
jgi:hypothetical protein